MPTTLRPGQERITNYYTMQLRNAIIIGTTHETRPETMRDSWNEM